MMINSGLKCTMRLIHQGDVKDYGLGHYLICFGLWFWILTGWSPSINLGKDDGHTASLESK
jgi:hypothetical protein